MPQNCHSEERSDEESGAGLPYVSVNPPPQTPRFALGDTLRATFEARLLMTVWGQEDTIFPVFYVDLVRRELPRSVGRVFPKCGRRPRLEEAGEFNGPLSWLLRGIVVDGPGSPGR